MNNVMLVLCFHYRIVWKNQYLRFFILLETENGAS